MRTLLFIVMLLGMTAPANAGVNLAVSQQSGPGAQERASQLARQIGNALGTTINVVVLDDAAQVESWLNRYATAELALVETGYAAGKPGQFVVIGPGGDSLTLIGRQGIAGDLPQRIAAVLAGAGERSVPAATGVATHEQARGADRPAPAAVAVNTPSPAKSGSEDRYFVSYVYRERLHREPDPEHLAYWTQQLQSGAVTKQQLFETACDLEKKICNFR